MAYEAGGVNIRVGVVVLIVADGLDHVDGGSVALVVTVVLQLSRGERGVRLGGLKSFDLKVLLGGRGVP